MPTFQRLILGLLFLGPVAHAAGWLDTRLSDLESKRSAKLSPHQRAVAERIMIAARGYENTADDTFTLWIKAGRRDDDTIFIESLAELLWEEKTQVHLPLNNLIGKAESLRSPRNMGSVLVVENPTSDAEVYQDQLKLDGVLKSVLETGHFAVVLFVDDRNILEKLNPVLTDRLRVVDLTDAPACEGRIIE